jgi:hypothetical protein
LNTGTNTVPGTVLPGALGICFNVLKSGSALEMLDALGEKELKIF